MAGRSVRRYPGAFERAPNRQPLVGEETGGRPDRFQRDRVDESLAVVLDEGDLPTGSEVGHVVVGAANPFLTDERWTGVGQALQERAPL